VALPTFVDGGVWACVSARERFAGKGHGAMLRDDFDHQLQAALETRPVIEQAKGVLAGVRGATPDQAFAELRHVSQQHNVKLNALAEALVDVAAGISTDDALHKIVWLEWGSLLKAR
jgi:hypothetical protein